MRVKGKSETVTLFGDLKYEFYKIKTTKASYIVLASSFMSIIGLSVLISAIYTARADHLSIDQLMTTDPAFLSLSGTFLAQLAVGIFAVLSVTNEYGYGTIVGSFLLEPRRMRFLAAKLAVVISSVFVSTFLALAAAFTVGQKILSVKFNTIPILSLTAVRSVTGAALYLTILAAFCVGIAVVVRRTSGAVATLFGILLVLPIIISLLPSPWNVDIGKYLPSSAGVVLTHSFRVANTLTPWEALAVLLLYAIVWLGWGMYRIVRTDI